MLNLILFGPPGAGKGTQSEYLISRYKLVHLSTGDILRGEIREKTKLGMEAKGFIDKGQLVPDEVVIGMIREKLKANQTAPGFIFDGFPRTTVQASALDELLDEMGTPISGMLSLEVEHDELITRLMKRGEISGRSDDSDLGIIENRIKVYHNETSPLKDYYKKQGKYFPVQGMGTIEEIFERLVLVVDTL